MAKYISGTFDPPKRVEIVRPGDKSNYKKGQFGYAISYTTHPEKHTERGFSADGELVYLVSKTKDMRGGASYFSADALRFTTKAPRELTDELSDAERVAVDCLVQYGDSCKMLADLVPEDERRAVVRIVADQVRSLTRKR